MSARRPVAVVLLAAGVLLAAAGPAAAASHSADAALDRALARLVAGKDHPPGVIAVVQRGAAPPRAHVAGVASTKTGARPRLDDRMRLASVSKAFSGAAALAQVRRGALSLDDTIAARLPALPAAWGTVTLAQLLNHTSGVPDFSASKAFGAALRASLDKAPPPARLLDYVADQPLGFAPGSRYRYSNSDNIIIALMVEAASGRTYPAALARDVFGPLGLTRTSLPSGATIASPLIRGYDLENGRPGDDVTNLFAAGWTGASGGVVSTPRDANRFVRAYVRGATTTRAARARQFRFVAGGHSEPPGPGVNAAGLAVFRYRTRCGTVYGHTGNTAGYTQFVSATADGSRSATVAVNAQITPKSNADRFGDLRRVFELAVCAALD